MLVKVGTKVEEFEGTDVGTVFGKVGDGGLMVISPKYLNKKNENLLSKTIFQHT